MFAGCEGVVKVACCVQVGIHSALANKLMKELLQGKCVPGVHSYAPESVQPEVPIQPFLKGVKKRQAKAETKTPGKTRIDFQIQHNDESYTFLEVKSVTYTQQCKPHWLSSRVELQP